MRCSRPALNLGLLAAARGLRRAPRRRGATGRRRSTPSRGSSARSSAGANIVRGIYWLQMPGYAATERARRARAAAALVLLDRARRGMRCMAQAIGETRAPRLRAPHPAPDGHRQFRPARRRSSRPRSTNGIWPSTPTPTNGWSCPTPTAWRCSPTAASLGSKPYAASGAYINRMSDYCAGCALRREAKRGRGACPFNCLYWDFLIRHERPLGGQPAHGDALSHARRMAARAQGRHRRGSRGVSRRPLLSPQNEAQAVGSARSTECCLKRSL